jgi:hypothetical protein
MGYLITEIATGNVLLEFVGSESSGAPVMPGGVFGNGCVTACGDSAAENYNADADVVDNTLCTYAGVLGCTDPGACNFDLALGATIEDGSCTYPVSADLDCDGNCISGGTYTTVNVQEWIYSSWWGESMYTLTGYDGSWSLVSSDGTALTTDGDNFAGCLADDCYTISGISGSGSSYSFAYSLNGGSYVVPGNSGETGTDTFTTGAGSCGVLGCTDVDACNYDASLGATTDDGSCTYPVSAEVDCDLNCISGGSYTTVSVQETSTFGNTYTLTGYGGSWSLVSSDGTELANNGAYSYADSFAGCLADDCYTISGISGSGSSYAFSYSVNGAASVTPGNFGETGTDTFTTGAGLCDVAGCMDVNACNYDADLGVTVDDGSCTYPADACTDCAGADLGGQDCAGVCGGTSVVDECGVCGGSGPDAGFDCEGNPLTSSANVSITLTDAYGDGWYQFGGGDFITIGGVDYTMANGGSSESYEATLDLDGCVSAVVSNGSGSSY